MLLKIARSGIAERPRHAGQFVPPLCRKDIINNIDTKEGKRSQISIYATLNIINSVRRNRHAPMCMSVAYL